MQERDEIVISPKVIFDVLKKNAVFIIVTVLIFSLCSFFYTRFFIPKQYTSRMSLYVETVGSGESTSSYSNINDINYAQRLVATYTKMLNTTTFYNELSQELNERYTAAELKGKVKYISDDETEIFDVTVTADSPSEAKKIADSFAKIAPQKISSLKSKAELKICDEPSLPAAPSSPNTTKNVMLAFIAGLAISLVIAFIRHIADKKIKYSDEMTEIDGIPVLAAIPNFDNYVDKQKKR